MAFETDRLAGTIEPNPPDESTTVLINCPKNQTHELAAAIEPDADESTTVPAELAGVDEPDRMAVEAESTAAAVAIELAKKSLW